MKYLQVFKLFKKRFNNFLIGELFGVVMTVEFDGFTIH